MNTTINTNVGALVALQNLNRTNAELAQVQNRINTGRSVDSAKDNGAIFAIAQGMRAEVSSLGVVRQTLDRAMSTAEVSLAAGSSVSDLLVEMKSKALAATDATLTATQRDAFNADFVALRNQIVAVVNNAAFNGTNLVDGSTANFVALASADGTRKLTLAAQDLSLSGAIVTLAGNANISTVTLAQGALTALETSLTNVNQALAQLGTASKSAQMMRDFIVKLGDSLEGGVGNLVDADLARESAKLQSLQVKQQLGAQALSIANQAPQIILSFFR
jgi:flagellin